MRGSRWRPVEHWAPGTWTRGRILAALRDWFELTGERPRIYDWSPSDARHLGLYGPRCEFVGAFPPAVAERDDGG